MGEPHGWRRSQNSRRRAISGRFDASLVEVDQQKRNHFNFRIIYLIMTLNLKWAQFDLLHSNVEFGRRDESENSSGLDQDEPLAG